jgi:phosphatidylethanolamine-binding protein (PEBP) family uncharacterized protein
MAGDKAYPIFGGAPPPADRGHQYLASLAGRDAAAEPSQGEHAPVPAA